MACDQVMFDLATVYLADNQTQGLAWCGRYIYGISLGKLATPPHSGTQNNAFIK